MTRVVRYSGLSLLLFLAASCRPTTQSPPSPATGDKAATSPSPQAPHQDSSSAAAPMPDAEQTLSTALTTAAAEQKNVLIHFGAPT